MHSGSLHENEKLPQDQLYLLLREVDSHTPRVHHEPKVDSSLGGHLPLVEVDDQARPPKHVEDEQLEEGLLVRLGDSEYVIDVDENGDSTSKTKIHLDRRGDLGEDRDSNENPRTTLSTGIRAPSPSQGWCRCSHRTGSTRGAGHNAQSRSSR